MSSSVGIITPNIWKIKMFQTTNQLYTSECIHFGKFSSAVVFLMFKCSMCHGVHVENSSHGAHGYWYTDGYQLLLEKADVS